MNPLGVFLVVGALTVLAGYAATHDHFENLLGKEAGRRKAWQTGIWLGIVVGLGAAAMVGF